MEFYKITKGDLMILNMDGLDIDSDSADEIYLKEVVSKLFRSAMRCFSFSGMKNIF
jgi:hypothetical protein